MTTLFKPSTLEDHHFLLASHMPNGNFWSEAFNVDDDFGKLLLGIAVEFLRFQSIEENLLDEMNINKTEDLLSEWEKSVGIPDKCFSTNKSNEDRRDQILQKFSKFGGVQTDDDFIRVASDFGFNVTVETGKQKSTFPLFFPSIFSLDVKSAAHTIYIELSDILVESSQFALLFPINFSVGGKDFLQCIFDKLAPANVKVIVVNSGDI